MKTLKHTLMSDYNVHNLKVKRKWQVCLHFSVKGREGEVTSFYLVFVLRKNCWNPDGLQCFWGL